MTDPQFEKLLARTAKAQRKYNSLLILCEQEYERRYGSYPSDVDDDSWIDSLHGAGGMANELTVEEVDKGAKMSGLSRIDK